MPNASWYIHLHDPTFFEVPWPGVRRLGPFTSANQALEQAASDLAGGSGAGVLGIFTGTASKNMQMPDVEIPDRDEAQDRKKIENLINEVPVFTYEAIRERADEILAEREKNLTQEALNMKEQIRAALPEGTENADELAHEILKLTGRMR